MVTFAFFSSERIKIGCLPLLKIILFNQDTHLLRPCTAESQELGIAEGTLSYCLSQCSQLDLEISKASNEIVNVYL